MHIRYYRIFLCFLKIIYLSLAVLSLHCCKSFSVVEESRRYSLVVHGFLIGVASLAAERGL